MTLGIVLLCLAIVVLLLGSAFFSSSETGLTATSQARMHALAQRNLAQRNGAQKNNTQKNDRLQKNAQIVGKLLANKEKLISTLLIGNNLVNVLATSLATSAAIALFAEGGVLLASLAMTILLVIFAEVLPKTYAFHHADRMALLVAKPVRILVIILTPLTWALDLLVSTIIKPKIDDDDEREEELRGMIKLHGANTRDAETKEQSAMLSSVLDLGEVTVEAVMTHRAAVEMINAKDKPEAILKQITESPYTRHPVYAHKPDNIIGVIHVKAVLRGAVLRGAVLRRLGQSAEGGVVDLADIAAPPYYVPETTLLRDQLQAFKKRREHFAMVVDEYGALRGIITLEDILEEIVGDIDDEHDISLSGLVLQDDGSYIVDGHVTIRDLNRALGWNLPDDNVATIAGLVIHETRTIPETGHEFRFYNTRFKVLQRTPNKLERLRLWPDTTSDRKADTP